MDDILDIVEEGNVNLTVIINDGLVGIRFGRETAFVTWIDAVEMATRIIAGAYEAAAAIEVDPQVLMQVQVRLFNEVMTELRNGDEDAS